MKILFFKKHFLLLYVLSSFINGSVLAVDNVSGTAKNTIPLAKALKAAPSPGRSLTEAQRESFITMLTPYLRQDCALVRDEIMEFIRHEYVPGDPRPGESNMVQDLNEWVKVYLFLKMYLALKGFR
ncbi:hypothetical protein BH11VER1_BH11VER1_32250 [soil metagenome]